MKKRRLIPVFLCFCFLLIQSLACANPADEDSLAYTLQDAAGRGDIKEVRKLLRQESRFDNDNYYYGKIMAFVEAAKFGQQDIMHLLLQHGVKVDDVDDGGDFTALSAAASKGRLKTMRLLLDLGAQVNIAPDPGGSTPLMYAADHGQVEAMQLLLSHGAKVNTYDDNGRTALMYAADSGSLPAVKLLLKNKADVNLHPTEENIHHFIDSMGWSPLMFAAYQGHLSVVQYLLDQGANVNATAHNSTAFLLACWKGHPAVAKLLFAHGAHIQGTNDLYKPALELAAQSGSLELVQFLLEKGADVNAQMPKDHPKAQYSDCYTALMQASLHGHTDIVKLLLKHKANPNKTEKEGHTARDLAQKNNHSDIVELLNTRKENITPYNLSKAPKALQGLNIPDFLAFATNNKETTPLSAVKKQGFFSGEVSYQFDLQEPYFTKYHGKIADYGHLLESQGFVFTAGWEGYYHFDKKWQGKYVMVTVGTYGYDTSGIMVSITLTKERYNFPPHHNISPYEQ